jgi:hypothetical protein
MTVHYLAMGIPDTDIDWTSVILGFFAMLASIYAASASHRTNRRIRTPNGKTIGELVDSLDKTLNEARRVREHEVGELENIERARIRVSNEIANLTRLLDQTFHKVEGDKNDQQSGEN